MTAHSARPGSRHLVAGPEEYLFGEEKALLEVIEGNEPLPRVDYPPYEVGLFATRASPNPALVNNVETLSHIPLIVENGVRFRSRGDRPGSPGSDGVHRVR